MNQQISTLIHNLSTHNMAGFFVNTREELKRNISYFFSFLDLLSPPHLFSPTSSLIPSSLMPSCYQAMYLHCREYPRSIVRW